MSDRLGPVRLPPSFDLRDPAKRRSGTRRQARAHLPPPVPPTVIILGCCSLLVRPVSHQQWHSRFSTAFDCCCLSSTFVSHWTGSKVALKPTSSWLPSAHQLTDSPSQLSPLQARQSYSSTMCVSLFSFRSILQTAEALLLCPRSGRLLSPGLSPPPNVSSPIYPTTHSPSSSSFFPTV